ncbi:hypothetical protein [Hydrogenovibrio marinus]|uniref:BstA-like C-terminal domain-containing protein n=1 Tax=Hydrogenovibrio marinus TaxID=28885 RepID=A0A066ZRS3_HYDMR|nr:hypothetical protein [Hydrogenovibrio marinus]KDN96513.1 hypothetical protein EI16_09635 [Hydrogenovibrio marinus]BBN60288.1 hypothetical protein HVMH_1882 [Hydrogenovibrio marinus]
MSKDKSDLSNYSTINSSNPASVKLIKNNELMSINSSEPAPPLSHQHPLDLGIEVEKDVGGIEMGVLENGIPYLTQNGLSQISGTSRRVLYDITQEWEHHFDDSVLTKGRMSFIKDYLLKNGFNEPQLYIETVKDGSVSYAYPDIVCMAILEFYAFESRTPNPVAIENYRRFAAFGLRKFIYEALEYTPSDKWKYHHDRVSLLKDSSPLGYFTVFNEITGLIVDLITANLTVNDKTVPDISVGLAWGKYWKENNLASKYGERMPYEHNYPDYYPQATSNPQTPNAYPDQALPEFRAWFKQIYLRTKFPAYILKKADLLPGGEPEMVKIANMYATKELEK